MLILIICFAGLKNDSKTSNCEDPTENRPESNQQAEHHTRQDVVRNGNTSVSPVHTPQDPSQTDPESDQLANGVINTNVSDTPPPGSKVPGQTQQSNVDWSKLIQAAKYQQRIMHGNVKKRKTPEVGYSESSLYCLSLTNPFRRACISIVEWR